MRGRAERVVGVLSRQRPTLAVLSRGPVVGDARAVVERDLRDQISRAASRRGEMLADLAAALDGWEERASDAGLAKIQEIRERWGMAGGDDAGVDPLDPA